MPVISKKIIFQFLEQLEDKKTITQKDLSIKLKVSIGFVNALIKKFLKKGLIKAKQAPYKRFIYYLTPKGFSEKSKLISDYIESSLDIFRTLRGEFTQIFLNHRDKNFVLFGISEITEICIISALENKVKISYIVDKNYTNEEYLGIKVIKKGHELKRNELCILTDYSSDYQKTYLTLQKKVAKHKILSIPYLSLSKNKNSQK